mmetsp:Transcript_26132/g.67372  ORF Transcript_26132/g.67372 Transcript_26132/m.67372 type:complete len:266 (+) Transcript_26132:3936-4733(+)
MADRTTASSSKAIGSKCHNVKNPSVATSHASFTRGNPSLRQSLQKVPKPTLPRQVVSKMENHPRTTFPKFRLRTRRRSSNAASDPLRWWAGGVEQVWTGSGGTNGKSRSGVGGLRGVTPWHSRGWSSAAASCCRGTIRGPSSVQILAWVLLEATKAPVRPVGTSTSGAPGWSTRKTSVSKSSPSASGTSTEYICTREDPGDMVDTGRIHPDVRRLCGAAYAATVPSSQRTQRATRGRALRAEDGGGGTGDDSRPVERSGVRATRA